MTSDLIACGGSNGEIRIHDLSTYKCVHAIDSALYHKGLIHVNKVAVNGNALGVAGNPWIRLHPVDNLGAPGTVYEGHTSNVTSLSFQADNKWFVSTGEDGKLRLWDLRARGFELGLSHGTPINCSDIHPNQGIVVFGDQAGYVNYFDLAGNSVMRRKIGEDSIGLGVHSLLFDDFNQLVCVHHNACLSLIPEAPASVNCSTETMQDPDLDPYDDASPRHSLTAPALIPLMSRSVSSNRATRKDMGLEHKVVTGAESIQASSFTNDIHSGTYITQVSLGKAARGQPRPLALSVSDGSVSVWRAVSTDDLYSLDVHVRTVNQTWCWDTKLLDNRGRYALAAFADGKCRLLDLARPGSPQVSVFDAGCGKSVRSLALIS